MEKQIDTNLLFKTIAKSFLPRTSADYRNNNDCTDYYNVIRNGILKQLILDVPRMRVYLNGHLQTCGDRFMQRLKRLTVYGKPGTRYFIGAFCNQAVMPDVWLLVNEYVNSYSINDNIDDDISSNSNMRQVCDGGNEMVVNVSISKHKQKAVIKIEKDFKVVDINAITDDTNKTKLIISTTFVILIDFSSYRNSIESNGKITLATN